jgi:hypothetical protein
MEPKDTHVVCFTRRSRFRALLLLTGGRLRRPAQLCGACLAAGQDAAMGTNVALDLRAGKVEWHGCA